MERLREAISYSVFFHENEICQILSDLTEIEFTFLEILQFKLDY